MESEAKEMEAGSSVYVRVHGAAYQAEDEGDFDIFESRFGCRRLSAELKQSSEETYSSEKDDETVRELQAAAYPKPESPPLCTREEPLGNPFFNELVLKNLFCFLKLKDLKECRRVCSTWNTAVEPYIWKRSEIIFDLYDSVEGNMTEFEHFVDDHGHFPVNKFKFIRAIENPIGLLSFLKRFGPDMTSISLHIFGNKLTSQTFQSFLSCCEFSKLQDLEFGQLPDEKAEEISFPVFKCVQNVKIKDGKNWTANIVLNLLKHCPNVQSFVFECDQRGENPLGEFKQFEMTGAHIKKIVLYWSKVYASIQSILDSKLQLTHLQFEGTCESTLTEDPSLYLLLLSFLEDQRQTLKKFYLPKSSPTSEDVTSMRFPVMEVLQELRLGWLIIPIVSKMQFSQIFPALEVFDMGSLEFSKIPPHLREEFITFLGSENTTVKRLAMPRSMCSINFILSVGHAFPKIESLRLVCHSIVNLSELWRIWTELRDLKLCIYPTINSEIPEFVDRLPSSIFKLDNFVRKPVLPGIHVLENVTKLRIVPQQFCTVGNYLTVTDSTCYCGVIHLTRLQELHISNSELTRECVRFLISKLPDLHTYSFESSRFTGTISRNI